MSAPATSLLFNVTAANKQGLLQSIFSNQPGTLPDFIDASGENFNVSGLIPTTNPGNGRYWDYYDLSAAMSSGGLVMVIGPLEEPPTGGTFPLAYSADSTGLTALAYNVTPTALAAALNANPTFISGSFTCSVTQDSPGADYIVTMNQVGVRSLLTSGQNLLTPPSAVEIIHDTVGSVSVQDVQIIRLLQKPLAFNSTWTALPGPGTGLTVTAITNLLQTLVFTAGSYQGAACLFVATTVSGVTTTTNVVINWNDPAATVQTNIAALANVGAGNVTVSGAQGGPYAIQFSGTALVACSSIVLTPTNLNIVVPIGAQGWLNPNTDPMLAALDAALPETSITTNFAVSLLYPGDPYPKIIYQGNCTVNRSAINTSTIQPVPTPTPAAWLLAVIQSLPPLSSATGPGQLCQNGGVPTVSS